MAGTYDVGGNVRKGGFFVHYRDDFGRCVWAFVTAAHSGQRLNLKEVPNSPDPLMWRPGARHGAGKGCWHFPDQCDMTDAQIREDEAIVTGPAMRPRPPLAEQEKVHAVQE